LRMQLQRGAPLSIRSPEEYRRYVERFGKLPTSTFNEISGLVESEERGLYFLLMPPGSGKTFLLYQLREEFARRGPVLLRSFSSSLENFQAFVSSIDRELARSVAAWVQSVTGRSLHSDTADVLTIAGAVATAANASIPFVLLLDEVPLSGEKPEQLKTLADCLESLLRRADGLGGFRVHIVIASHAVSEDLSRKLLDELRIRGGVQRFSQVRTYTKMELAPGFEGEAVAFVGRLAGGAPLDPFILRTAVEMLKRGFVFRQLVTFVEGATRRARSVDLERDIHTAIVEKLRSELRKRGFGEGRASVPSRPDLVLADGTCIEVKVRAGAPDVNPAQHAGCAKKLYVLVSPEPADVPGAQIVHARANVEQMVSALETLKMREGKGAYEGALALLAETVVATVLEKLAPSPPEAKPDPRVQLLCSKLSEIFEGRPALSRTDVANSAAFKAILRELAPLAPKELREELESCLKKPKAGCVDLLAKVTEKVYGRTALKVSGSKVTLGPLCSRKQEAQPVP